VARVRCRRSRSHGGGVVNGLVGVLAAFDELLQCHRDEWEGTGVYPAQRARHEAARQTLAQLASTSHEGTLPTPAEAASAPLASGDPKARDTLRGELEALADSWQDFAVNGHYIKSLRALIRKHYGAS
jgi:hypothetical protein